VAMSVDLDSLHYPVHLSKQRRCQKSKVQSTIWTWHLSGDRRQTDKQRDRYKYRDTNKRSRAKWRHINWTLNQVVKRLGDVFRSWQQLLMKC